jgi:hypothetical protein
MPNHHKDALMIQSVFALAQGCGEARIDIEASEWFREHYHPWIDTKKANGKTPQGEWAAEGTGFLGKFKEIGRRAVKDGIVSKEALMAAAMSVEKESDCPFCSLKP